MGILAIDDELCAEIKRRAAARDTTDTALVVAALRSYLELAALIDRIDERNRDTSDDDVLEWHTRSSTRTAPNATPTDERTFGMADHASRGVRFERHRLAHRHTAGSDRSADYRDPGARVRPIACRALPTSWPVAAQHVMSQ